MLRSRAAAYWALLVSTHLLAVLYSRGYFQFDEHYQVLEFIQWKLGLVHTRDMPWELTARMRPWLHPLMFFPVEWLSLHTLHWSPFAKTTVHRALVAAIALLVISRRTRRRPELLPLYASLFFFPFIDVRISSEVIGGWLFVLAYTLDDERGTNVRPLHSFGCGVLFGLAAVIRMQVLALLLGLLLFHLRNRMFRRSMWLCVGLLPAFGLGVLVDRWGYGRFTYAPWNYVYENIVLGKAVRFGTGASPWYWYFTALLEKTCFVPGAVFLASLCWQWVRRPLSKLTLVTLPFVVLHIAIAHKELRYLFPIAPFMPELVFGLWQAVRGHRAARYTATAFIALNLILLAPAALHDADAEVGLYAALHSLAPAEPVLQYVNNTNPLAPWRLNPSYYLGSLKLRGRPLRAPHKPSRGLFMFDSQPTYLAMRAEGRCQLLATRYPAYLLDNWPSWALPPTLGPWLKLWSLWRCP
ncbi:MAG: hypothetical protein ABW321_15230 [Polyangiales bacterium]